MKQQQEVYKMAGVDDDEPAYDPAKKRKAAEQEVSCLFLMPRNDAINMQQLEANKKAKANAPAPGNSRASTAIFISGLPEDVDTEEVREVFKKYGIIAESADNDEQRVKLYNDANGKFKGEALISMCCFSHNSINANEMQSTCDQSP